jgi:hypothetical protein
VELRVSHRGGTDQTVSLPPEAVELLEDALDRLRQGRSVALVERDSELSPNDAATILGISRPLVVLRMDCGDLSRFLNQDKQRSTDSKPSNRA